MLSNKERIMTMNIKLIDLDDKSSQIIPKMQEIERLTDEVARQNIVGYNYSNCTSDSIQERKNIITSEITNILGEPTENQLYFIMLDYQLSAKSEAETLEFLNTTLNVLLTREDVFLVLYTSVAPSLCHRLFDYLINHAKDDFEDGKLKCKLFYKPMDLSFLHPPFNYEYKFTEILIPEIIKLKEGKIDDHWIQIE